MSTTKTTDDSNADAKSSTDWKQEAAKMLVGAAGRVDEVVDAAQYRLRKRLGLDEVRQIQPYRTYSNGTRGRVCGRVFANQLPGSPQDDAEWWDNLLATYRRWRSKELRDVPVSITLAGHTFEAKTNREGYYSVDFELDKPLPDDRLWHTATVVAPADETSPEVVVEAKVLSPPPTARFGVISDLDDTVLHSQVANILVQAKLTFLNNAKTRKPLEGVGGLYRAFRRGLGGVDDPEENPIFYVSSSAWNLYDLMEDFIDLNDIPLGPILLQDVGLDNNKFVKTGHQHKLDKTLSILEAYPDLPFVLIGDSGQEDASIYLGAAREMPGRVRAIYIHDVSPGEETANTTKVREAAAEAEALGVPMLLVSDSSEIAVHAVEQGLILPSAIDEVRGSRDRDRARPEG